MSHIHGQMDCKVESFYRDPIPSVFLTNFIASWSSVTVRTSEMTVVNVVASIRCQTNDKGYPDFPVRFFHVLLPPSASDSSVDTNVVGIPLICSEGE